MSLLHLFVNQGNLAFDSEVFGLFLHAGLVLVQFFKVDRLVHRFYLLQDCPLLLGRLLFSFLEILLKGDVDWNLVFLDACKELFLFLLALPFLAQTLFSLKLHSGLDRYPTLLGFQLSLRLF